MKVRSQPQAPMAAELPAKSVAHLEDLWAPPAQISSGTAKENTLPLPTLLSAQMRPPVSSTRRFESGSPHPAGGDASEEADCEEKEAGCGSGPSGSIAAGGLRKPNSSAGARLGRGGAIRHQLSLAVAIIERCAE